MPPKLKAVKPPSSPAKDQAKGSSSFSPFNAIGLSLVVAGIAFLCAGYGTGKWITIEEIIDVPHSTDSSSTSSSSSKAETTQSATARIPKSANLEGKPREAETECADRYPDQCNRFVKQGECTKNPGWMIMNCPAGCNSCELRNPKLRCDRNKLNIPDEPVYKPGDMNAMFENILENFQHYEPSVLSKPSDAPNKPWVVTLDNFLSDEEVDALISTNSKFERSTDTGSSNEFGETGRILSQGRTSSNSWCRGECRTNTHVKNVISKIENVTGVPSGNYESFQVLKYELGQRYNVHHDYGQRDTKLISGPRILTFFLYLSDVEEGGETAFPTLKLSVAPKKGKALLWPSVLDSDLERQDPSTMHEAKAVTKGVKYAANSWIHLYNYEVPNLWGCTGTFDDLSS